MATVNRFPDASVIIPTHNRRRDLIDHLEALSTAQLSLDIIVVMDQCTDDTAQALHTFKPGCPYALTITQTKLSKGNGVCRARNIGLSLATANVVVFQDDDCIPTDSDCIPHLIEPVAPGVAAMGRFLPPESDEREPASFIDWRTGNAAAWKPDIQAAGAFDENLTVWGFDDLDMAYRLHQHGVRFVWAKGAVVRHLNSPYAADPLTKAEKWRQSELNCRYLEQKHGTWPPEVGS